MVRQVTTKPRYLNSTCILVLNINHWFYGTFLVSWMNTKLVSITKSVTMEMEPGAMVTSVGNILVIYKELGSQLGLYLGLSISLFQINWIIVAYFGITSYFTDLNYSFAMRTVFGSGCLFTTLGG